MVKGLAADLVHVDDAKGDHVVLVPLDRIENLPTVDELRMSRDQFQQLCSSIDQDGLHQPVTLRPLADKLYELVAGRHRAVAHVELGLDVVPAVIRADLDDAGATIATAVENLARADLRPYEEAEAYQAILDVDGMTQAKVAKRVGVSQGQVSKRLKLLQVPKEIAVAADADARLEDLLWFAPVAEVPAWLPKVAKAIEKMGGGYRYGKARAVMDAVCDGKTAWAPFEQAEELASIEKAGWNARWWILDNSTFRKDIYALEHVRFGPEKSPDLVVVHGDDVKKAKEAAERALQRYQAQQQKQADEGPAANHGSAMSAAAKREQRVQNKARKLQLEAMVDHVKAQDGFDEQLVRFAYKEFLSSVGQVASRKVEQQALADILGEYAPPERKTTWGGTEKPLARGCPELVDQLWDQDRVVLDRYVAAVVHLHAGGYDHFVRDAKVHKFTTGKTPAAIKKAAETAVDGPKKAKKPAKKNGKAGLEKMLRETQADAKQAAREHEIQRQKEYPHYCLWAPCRRRFKTDAELEEHTKSCKHVERRPACPQCNKWIKPTPQGKVPRHKDNKKDDWCDASGQDLVDEPVVDARPGAAAGKECPDCKAIVQKKGKGAEARLECFCTGDGGVPVEVPA